MDDFDVWVKSVVLGDEHGSTDSWPAGAVEIARQIFDEYGAVGAEQLADLVQQAQVTHAAAAVAAFGDDLTATTELVRPSFEYRLENASWGPRVAYFGRYSSSPVTSLIPAQITCEVCDFMQEEVVEDLWGGWPVCPDHSGTVLAQVIDDVAVWFCRSGGHALAAIGQLAR